MNHLLKAALLGIIVWGTAFGLGNSLAPELYHPHFPFVIGFFVFGSWAAHNAIIASLKGNAARFPAYFMGITGLRMLAYVLAIGIYVFLMREEAIPVIVVFLLSYVLFTVLELVSIVPKARQNHPSEGEGDR